MTTVVDRIVDSTIGASLLSLLEYVAASPGSVLEGGSVEPPPTSRPEHVARGAELAAALPFGRLTEMAVLGSDSVGSHWDPARALPVLQLRELRRPIAEALVERTDFDRWTATGGSEQWWWTDGGQLRDARWRRLGTGLDQLAIWWATHPQQCLLTTSPLARGWESFGDLVHGTWDLCFGPVGRWKVSADPAARVFEIRSAEDWADLVGRYPADASDVYGNGIGGWELDVLNPGLGLQELLAVPGQRAARRGWRRILTPDWAAVARDWDGVHLTWLGYLTADGTVTDLGDGDVTLLRNWGSERTVWLAPVLGAPEPLPVETGMLDDARPSADASWGPEGEWLRRFACQSGSPDPVAPPR